MAQSPSAMLPLGTPMPEFSLPDIDGANYSSTAMTNRPALVIFMCNHCPFVKQIIDVLVDCIRYYQEIGVEVVAVSSNDAQQYPDDAPDYMGKLSRDKRFSFPYLYDETQKVAEKFHAACTPDFYLFDRKGVLVYRGQFDDARPSLNILVTGRDLTNAVEAVVRGGMPSQQQKPSIGCGIKWKR